MMLTAAGWGLLAVLLSFFLLILWRLIAARSGVAIACFVAAYFILAGLFRLADPQTLLRPIWLPFVYIYSWLAIATVLWAAATMRVTRRALSFPGQPPLLSALFSSQLALHLGVVALSPWLGWRPLAAYAMLPPVVVVVSYGCYRLFAYVVGKLGSATVPWPILGGAVLLAPFALMALGKWLVPYLLGWV